MNVYAKLKNNEPIINAYKLIKIIRLKSNKLK